ncbi:biotin/lipoyl-containing protein [Chitinolyticbacter albus]|uniref:biotin/lipoyl-containing protein n=1 Tax=Chitinolyticbacter albus TaxID=2961951 RepID=UPI00210EAA3E|nr:biotin/lipoyl-containing protein [Chitinolyticbacter albus]
MPQTTTHLICAPALRCPATVTALHAQPGHWVHGDAPLVSLDADGAPVVVHAPAAGTVASFVVSVNDTVDSDELLLMMEIEEEDSDWLALIDGLPPACAVTPTASSPQTGDILQVTRAAAALAARLGVDLSQVNPEAGGLINEAVVERWVRQALGR